jgi:hypothetical protein
VLELIRSDKKIKLDDQTYSIKPITKARALKHEALVKECEGDTEKVLKVFSDLLTELGMPIEVVDGLEMDHFKMIADYLFESKKK